MASGWGLTKPFQVPRWSSKAKDADLLPWKQLWAHAQRWKLELPVPQQYFIVRGSPRMLDPNLEGLLQQLDPQVCKSFWAWVGCALCPSE